MKYNPLLLLLFAFVLFFSCNKKTTNIIAAKPKEEKRTEIKKEPADEIKIDESVLVPETVLIPKPPPQPKRPENYLLASLEKTECYGKCPTFVFKLESNGKATYHGKKYVDHYGEFAAYVDDAAILAIQEKAAAINFLQFKDQYPTNGHFLKDIPMTFISFHDGIHQKQIMNNFDSPKALLEFELFLEKIIEKLKWERVE